MTGTKVELIDYMGSDLSVVNAARVSFDKESEWEEYNIDGLLGPFYKLSDKDTKLIKFLARGMTTDQFEEFVNDLLDVASDFSIGPMENGETERLLEMLWQWRRTPEHFTPFAHPHVTFRIKAPIFVARQLGKHQVGFVWSEVSRRYVDSEPEFYTPETWRKRAEDVKQGSSDETVRLIELYPGTGMSPCSRSVAPERLYKELRESAQITYERFIKAGVCPEQARMLLPASLMTEWIWTGSLYGWASLYKQRKTGSHAQRECWPIAEAIGGHMKELFPVSWEALIGD